MEMQVMEMPRNETAGPVWVKCSPSSVPSVGLESALRKLGARVHRGPEAPQDAVPSAVVCCVEGEDDYDDVASAVRTIKAAVPHTPVLVLGPSLSLPLICAAVSAGARGFAHTGMPPSQLARAVSVVMAGEMALPREMLAAYLNWLNEQQRAPDLSSLSRRRYEILELVGEGLSNAQIAKRLFLTESTVKQHLRKAYKALGVKNRIQAASLLRRNGLGRHGDLTERKDLTWNERSRGVVPRSLAK